MLKVVPNCSLSEDYAHTAPDPASFFIRISFSFSIIWLRIRDWRLRLLLGVWRLRLLLKDLRRSIDVFFLWVFLLWLVFEKREWHTLLSCIVIHISVFVIHVYPAIHKLFGVHNPLWLVFVFIKEIWGIILIWTVFHDNVLVLGILILRADFLLSIGSSCIFLG